MTPSRSEPRSHRRSGWKPAFGDPFERCLGALDARDPDGLTWGLDIGCAVSDGGFVVNRDTATAKALDVERSDSNVALIYFVMRLLRQLQAVGSAPAIDYDAYLRSVPGTAQGDAANAGARPGAT